MSDKECILKFKFANEEAVRHFMTWLSEQGEQDYWTWMEYREQEEEGDITALQFKYDYKKNIVETLLGRLEEWK